MQVINLCQAGSEYPMDWSAGLGILSPPPPLLTRSPGIVEQHGKRERKFVKNRKERSHFAKISWSQEVIKVKFSEILPFYRKGVIISETIIARKPGKKQSIAIFTAISVP